MIDQNVRALRERKLRQDRYINSEHIV